jgi:aryl-alcohol dehydrogenase-like predicted oxidoreductase
VKIKSNKIIIGTWGLSGDLGRIQENPLNIFYKAIKLGFNEFDVAPTYGKGKIYDLINNIPTKIKKNMIFNTKCGYDEKKHKKTFSIKDIKNSLENSLDILGKINILYLHNPRNEIKDWKKIIDLIEILKKKNL